MTSHRLIQNIVNAFVTFFVLSVAIVIRRLFFHPLRSFKGPVTAAATWWYKAYWDLIENGGLIEHTKELHIKYGPVIRIGPDELHFNDPAAYADIYCVGSKLLKDPVFYRSFNEDESSFGYINPHDSKVRRDTLSPLFSRRAIIKLENLIQERVDNLIAVLLPYIVSEKSVNLTMAYRSLTLDVISSYCFAQCFNTLASDSFSHPILVSLQSSTLLVWKLKHFTFLRGLVFSAPDWLTLWMSPAIQGFVDMRTRLSAQIDSLLLHPESLENAEHEIVYHHLLESDVYKGRHVPSKKSLLDEAQTLMAAGSDTVGNTCAVGTFYVLNSPLTRTKLVQELREAWPDSGSAMSYERLEKLPYLTAVIKESLRMAQGVVSSLPRVVGPSGTVIAGLHIPAGTIVGMSSLFIHTNANIFPDPFTFSPERWLGENARELENYLVPFSKGPRMCLGINLAWSELYLIFGNVFRKLDMELHGTTVEDLAFRDYFLPVQKGPLHVLVKAATV